MKTDCLFLISLILLSLVSSLYLNKKSNIQLKAKLSTKQGTTGIQNNNWPNRFVRSDGTNVNAQYGQGPWETWILQKQNDGTYCIQNNAFPCWLSLNANSCSTMTGPGCGTVICQPACQAWEHFNIVPANGALGIQSVQWPNVWLRMDGSGITSSQGNGGGIVNAQWYPNGQLPNNYELWQIPGFVPCAYSVGNSCFQPWNGTPALANGQQFIINALNIFNASSRSTQALNQILSRSASDNGGYDIAPFSKPSVVNTSSNPTAANVVVASNVSGNQANWNFLDNNAPVNWDSSSSCGNVNNLLEVLTTSTSSIYQMRVNGCGAWSSRMYLATDWNAMKSDYDGYSDNTFNFQWFIKTN